MNENEKVSSIKEGIQEITTALNKIKGIMPINSKQWVDDGQHCSTISFRLDGKGAYNLMMKIHFLGGRRINTVIPEANGKVKAGYMVAKSREEDNVFLLLITAPDEEKQLTLINQLLQCLN